MPYVWKGTAGLIRGSIIMISAGVIQIDLVLVEPEEELIPLIRPW